MYLLCSLTIFGCNAEGVRLHVSPDAPTPVVINAFLDVTESHYKNRDDGTLVRTYLGDRGATFVFTYRRMNAESFTGEEVKLRRNVALDAEGKTRTPNTPVWDVEASNQRTGTDLDMGALAKEIAAAMTDAMKNSK